jgi:hypothetical protein
VKTAEKVELGMGEGKEKSFAPCLRRLWEAGFKFFSSLALARALPPALALLFPYTLWGEGENELF